VIGAIGVTDDAARREKLVVVSMVVSLWPHLAVALSRCDACVRRCCMRVIHHFQYTLSLTWPWWPPWWWFRGYSNINNTMTLVPVVSVSRDIVPDGARRRACLSLPVVVGPDRVPSPDIREKLRMIVPRVRARCPSRTVSTSYTAMSRLYASSGSSVSSTSSGTPDLPGSKTLRIVLMRHGESFPTQNSSKDHERAVTPSGVEKVQRIARTLQAMGFTPHLLLSSNSARSKQTYAMMKEAMPALEEADLHFFGSLYTESQLDGHTLPHLMELIRRLGDVSRHSCVLCLGHNKGWEEAASALAGEQVMLKNGDAALFELEIGEGDVVWRDAMSRVGQRSGWRFVDLLSS
jgi:phosphohistidine phosphatase